MTGLETRGLRPDRMARGAVGRMIYEDLDRRWRLARYCVTHELLWGVPCGPTLTMVRPTQLRGIDIVRSL